jgi:hypothetical protein
MVRLGSDRPAMLSGTMRWYSRIGTCSVSGFALLDGPGEVGGSEAPGTTLGLQVFAATTPVELWALGVGIGVRARAGVGVTTGALVVAAGPIVGRPWLADSVWLADGVWVAVPHAPTSAITISAPAALCTMRVLVVRFTCSTPSCGADRSAKCRAPPVFGEPRTDS